MAGERQVGDSKSAKVLLGTTPKGKEMYYVARANSTVRFIELGSGGKLPKGLQGGFSSVGNAQLAVNAYLAAMARGEEKEPAAQSKQA